MPKVTAVLRGVTRDGEIVDFIQIDPSESELSHYMLHDTKPFYRRRRFGLF